jgi:hypothetical protein
VDPPNHLSETHGFCLLVSGFVTLQWFLEQWIPNSTVRLLTRLLYLYISKRLPCSHRRRRQTKYENPIAHPGHKVGLIFWLLLPTTLYGNRFRPLFLHEPQMIYSAACEAGDVDARVAVHRLIVHDQFMI